MSTSALKICIEVLSLPRDARAEIAHRLLVSLEKDRSSTDIEDAWKDEAERRFKRLKAGKSTTRDAKRAVGEARKKLSK
jgi:putative addiction module component (TIGR02574 family)